MEIYRLDFNYIIVGNGQNLEPTRKTKTEVSNFCYRTKPTQDSVFKKTNQELEFIF